ncbi:MAG: hypothetical protein DMG34_20735 [Acidobacteria bacterium]|nr:MAG: hypothetical protein DMG34_20735 [Acidobacteriota bacterium]
MDPSFRSAGFAAPLKRNVSAKTFPLLANLCTAFRIDASLARHHNARNPSDSKPRRNHLLALRTCAPQANLL